MPSSGYIYDAHPSGGDRCLSRSKSPTFSAWSASEIALHSRYVGFHVLDQAARGVEERAGVQPVVLVDDQIPHSHIADNESPGQSGWGETTDSARRVNFSRMSG